MIEPFDRTRHDRAPFDCGESSLNDFLKNRAGQNSDRDLTRSYVATPDGSTVVVAYYALCTSGLEWSILPPKHARKLPQHPIPAMLFARLGVDRGYQGRGLGEDLLLDALARCVRAAGEVAAAFIDLHAIGPAAAAFYARYGFTPLLDDPHHLYLSMRDARALALP